MPSNVTSALKHLSKKGTSIWDQIANLIIRPPRSKVTEKRLGPNVFRLVKPKDPNNAAVFKRTDFTLENPRGFNLVCAWYHPTAPSDQWGPLPCVVYLHGNSGSRADGQDILFLLEYGFTVLTYDASGCGQSSGDYISLGFYERQDIMTVVDFLRASGRVSTIGLWGRSMGAVTAIMYSAKDPTINAIVCDSPFSSLRGLAVDLVDMHASLTPDFATDMILSKLRKNIAKRAGFDLDDLDTMKYAAQCKSVPSFIFHGEDDNFVRAAHSGFVAEAYGGSCIYRTVPGNHNDPRPEEINEIALAFLSLYLIEKPQAALAANPVQAAAAAAALEARKPPLPIRAPCLKCTDCDTNTQWRETTLATHHAATAAAQEKMRRSIAAAVAVAKGSAPASSANTPSSPAAAAAAAAAASPVASTALPTPMANASMTSHGSASHGARHHSHHHHDHHSHSRSQYAASAASSSTFSSTGGSRLGSTAGGRRRTGEADDEEHDVPVLHPTASSERGADFHYEEEDESAEAATTPRAAPQLPRFSVGPASPPQVVGRELETQVSNFSTNVPQ
jgi:pimeloyl-ACP methyl ester carboxylesterase